MDGEEGVMGQGRSSRWKTRFCAQRVGTMFGILAATRLTSIVYQGGNGRIGKPLQGADSKRLKNFVRKSSQKIKEKL